MANWKAVGIDMGTGAAAGVIDEIINKKDIDRLPDYNAKSGQAAVTQIPWQKRIGTYYSYGVPLLAVGAIAMNKLPGVWATRLAVVGGQLAGRQATKATLNKMAIGSTPSKAPVYYKPVPQYVPAPNPQIPNYAQVVPIVSPQRNLGAQGLTG